MKKLLMVFILAMYIVGPGYAFSMEKRTLTGVFEPGMMAVAASELYVVEGANIFVFSLQDLSLKHKFGGQGEGPGELKAADFWHNTVTVLPGQIFIDGYDKTVYFSKEGKFLREAKKPVGISQMVPVGNSFAAVKLDQLEGDVQYQCLYLYDSSLEYAKELCRQESPIQSMARKTEMIPDVLNFSVWEDTIFVERSRDGFVIEAFDSRGDQLYKIEKTYKKIPVTEVHKNEAVKKLEADPFVKRVGLEEFKKFSQLVWPNSLPAIRDITVVDKKIYVQTFKTQDGKENWMILDLKGQTLSSIYLPRVDSAPLMANLYGVNYYTIHKNKFYFLKYNEEEDGWELHIQEIK